MKIQYRQFSDQVDLPLIRAGVDLLGMSVMEQDEQCLDSFNGAIDWRRITLESGVQGSEIIFLCESNGLHVCMVDYDGNGVMKCQYLDVRAHTSSSYLSSLIHTVMAPAFTPGFVGVDWGDMKIVLRSGSHAQLVMVHGTTASNLLDMVYQVKEEQGPKVQGLLLVIFLRDSDFALPIYQQAARLLETEFDCNGLTLIAVPALADLSEPMLGLLAVYA